MSNIKRLLIFFCSFLTFLSVSGLAYYCFIMQHIPDKLYVNCDDTTIVDIKLPVTGRIIETDDFADFSKPVSVKAGEEKSVTVQYKLFNIIKLRKAVISAVGQRSVYPGGYPVGIYLKTRGVMVCDTGDFVGEDGRRISPAEGILEGGDYILDIDGVAVNSKRDIAAILESCSENVRIRLLRDGAEMYVDVKLMRSMDGGYRLGVWVKDDSQGIGTMTYVTEEGDYGALGHCIGSEGECLVTDYGYLYKTRIVSVTKGSDGEPGEYVGSIDYNISNRLGIITDNVDTGIYGRLNDAVLSEVMSELKPLPVGLNSEIKKGRASIRVCLEDECRDYDIYIEDVRYGKDNKNIVFHCISEELLELTNGIVQGMSGSPIIQDGKLIGAVTHVFVNDPTRGYGIFIEEMLGE